MLNGILQIGQYLTDCKKAGGGLEDIIENINENGMYKHVLKLSFEEKRETVEYKGIDYEELSELRMMSYAYKRGSPRGGDFTPTSRLTDAEKTLEKIRLSISDIADAAECCEETKQFRTMAEIIGTERTKIQADIAGQLKALKMDKGEKAILTVVLWEKEEEKYAGDYVIVKKHLQRMADERYYSKYGKVSKGIAQCYYCKSREEVFGFVNTFNFYTVDKTGFVSGGFRQENAWKNYPVCSRCAQKLNVGRRFVDQYLTSSFAGFNYSIIPKFIFYDVRDWSEMGSILHKYERNAKFSLAEKTKDGLLRSEDRMTELMSEGGNQINYNMLIFKEEQSGNVFRILLYIEDIIPSRLKRMLKIKDELDGMRLFRDLPKKDGSYNLVFNFEKFRLFFPNNKIEGNFDKSFLEILNNMFSHRPVDYAFLMEMVMVKLRGLFMREEYTHAPVLQALMCVLFIKRLGLFKEKSKEVKKTMIEKNEKNAKYLEFLEEYAEIFDTDYKRAVFLTGVLVDRLLSNQFQRGSSKPFYSRLNGLKLNDALLKRIFREAINKLNEYEINHFYAELERVIALYILSEANLTSDDISFYFVLGMTLGKEFKEENKNQEANHDKK